MRYVTKEGLLLPSFHAVTERRAKQLADCNANKTAVARAGEGGVFFICTVRIVDRTIEGAAIYDIKWTADEWRVPPAR